MACECVVTRVVCGNGHNCTCSVACQNVIRNVDGNLLAVEGVDGVCARSNTAYALGLGDTLALGALLGLLDILLNCGFVLGCSQLAYPLVLGCDNHKCYAEDCVGASGEDLQLAVAARDVEEYLRANRTADPVTLNLLERIAPLERVHTVQHALCVSRNAKQPLLHALLNYGVAATHRESILNLVVSQHGAELRTPVNHCVGTECDAVVLQYLLLLGLVHCAPLGSGER